MILLIGSAALMTITAAVHSALGERHLIQPLITLGTGVMRVALAQRVLRFAWHLTSLLMLVCAFVLVWPGTPRTVIAVIGMAWLAAGLFDALYTRGRHIGWPLLVAAGALPLICIAI